MAERPEVDEIEITPEMIEAARQIFVLWDERDESSFEVTERALHAAMGRRALETL